MSSGWWAHYPASTCTGEPPWDALVGPALRHAGQDTVLQFLGDVSAAHGFNGPTLNAVMIGPSVDEAPYMQRLVSAAMGSGFARNAQGMCMPPQGSLQSFANELMWRAIAAYQGYSPPVGEEPGDPGYNPDPGPANPPPIDLGIEYGLSSPLVLASLGVLGLLLLSGPKKRRR